MRLDAAELNRRLQRATSRRSLWVQLWQDIYYLAMPMVESFFQESPGVENMDQIIDETAVVGVQEFASKLQHGLVPNGAKWARFEPGSLVPEAERQRVQAELDEVNDYVFEVINNSNFAKCIPEAFLDLAIGTGNLFCDEGPAHDPVRFEAASLTQMFLLPGSYGNIDHIFRVRKIKHHDILGMFPRANFTPEDKRHFSENPQGETQVAQCLVKDTGALDTERWYYDLLCMRGGQSASVQSETFSGLGACPWINFRWMTRANEVWGRGPMLFALPAVRTVNLTKRLILENAEQAISGLWQADDDGVVNVDTIELVPGTVLPRAPGSRGLEPINNASRFDVAQMIVADMQNNIKRALYILDLGPTDTTPMSATEVAARQADIAQRIGSAYGRLQRELVGPVLQRVIYILKEKGLIDLPKVDGKEVKIVPVSPLARAQRNDEVLKLTQFLGVTGQMLGPQAAQLYIDPAKALKHLANWYEIPAEILTTEEQRAQMMQQTAQAGAAVEEMEPGAAGEVLDMARGAMA